MLSLEYYYKVLLLLKMSSTWYNAYITFAYLYYCITLLMVVVGSLLQSCSLEKSSQRMPPEWG